MHVYSFNPPDLYPTVCNLCGGQVIFTSNKVIYGKEYGSGKCYLCEECGAYVGTHVPRPDEAYGILASAPMRDMKQKCHELFDAMWLNERSVQERRAARKSAYAKLADKLDIPVTICHFGYFDMPMLKKAYSILEKKEI